MTDNFLNISTLSKSYTDNNEKINVLSDLNLTLADNSIVSLLGPSGSGKSTLANALIQGSRNILKYAGKFQAK